MAKRSLAVATVAACTVSAAALAAVTHRVILAAQAVVRAPPQVTAGRATQPDLISPGMANGLRDLVSINIALAAANRRSQPSPAATLDCPHLHDYLKASTTAEVATPFADSAPNDAAEPTSELAVLPDFFESTQFGAVHAGQSDGKRSREEPRGDLIPAPGGAALILGALLAGAHRHRRARAVAPHSGHTAP
jgi:hypothetical protein